MKLIAIKQGFYDNRRIRVGQSFEFDETQQVEARKDGKPVLKDGAPVLVTVRPPSWAKSPTEAARAIAEQKAKESDSAGDTKPKGAQAASKAKHAENRGSA